MNEEKIMRKNLLKNMLVSLVVFTILFLIFDFIIYNQISISLYKDIDKELIAEEKIYIDTENGKIDKLLEKIESNSGEKKDNQYFKNLNPRIIMILRDENANILNGEMIGEIYKNYGDSITFDNNNLKQIYSIEIENKYTYRGLNFETTDSSNNKIYVQLLANVDGETKSLDNVFKTLVIGTAILISISIIASYILSRRMMLPIYKAYQKQTEFVENASHELRTPLTIIQAKQELLLQEPESKIIDKSEDINLTLKETRRLTKMIKELMSLARSDANEYKLNKESTDIDSLISDIVKPYIEFAKLEDKTVELDLKFGKNIKVDKNKITELMIILLDNAIKYTSTHDKITIKTYSKDGKCNIEVIDTGIGISDEGLKRVFDRFYREDKARSRATGGTGLGLSIAHTIISRHKGTIKAIHNNPKGTIFIVRLI